MVNTVAPTDVAVDGLYHAYADDDVLFDVTLRVEPATTLALLGPSGCGKTTLLRCIAGLEHPRKGTVRLGEFDAVGPSVFVAPERRRVGMVFQDGALFPHLSVRRNVAFGVCRADDRPGRVAEALDLVGLADLADRMPSTLSGGQQQRVALARALAPRPDVLLLDEPFANLDATLRTQLRSDVNHLLGEISTTAVFVTHDQDEAFVMGDEVAVMRDGRLLQQGPPAAVYTSPIDPWLAAFVGEANLLPAAATGPEAETQIGAVGLTEPTRGDVVVLVRPEHLVVVAGGPWSVVDVEFYGHDTLYFVARGDQKLRARAAAAPMHRPGDEVSIAYAGPDTVAFAQ